MGCGDIRGYIKILFTFHEKNSVFYSLHCSCLKIGSSSIFFGLFVFLTGVVVGACVFSCYYSRLVSDRVHRPGPVLLFLFILPSVSGEHIGPPPKIPFLLVRTGPVNFSTPSLSPPCWFCVQSKLKFLMHFPWS
jgi:hypothetical protein